MSIFDMDAEILFMKKGKGQAKKEKEV